MDMEDKKLELIAELMFQSLKKAGRISPITARDVVKMPDNYNLNIPRKEIYAACVDSIIVTATVWKNDKITIRIKSVYA